MQPHGPGAAQEEVGQDGQRQRQPADGGGVPPGKFGDEVLGLGLFAAGVFHQIQNLRHGGLAVGLGDLHGDQTVQVHAAADDLIAGLNDPGQALAGEGSRVQIGAALQHHAVQRHPLAGLDQNLIAHGHFVRVHLLYLAVLFQVGVVGADVHQRGNALAALAHSVVLEQFAHLVEQHNRRALVVVAQGHRTHGGNGHQEVLVEHLAVENAAHGFFQHVVADDKVGHQIQRQLQQAGGRHKVQDHQQRRRNKNALQHFLLFFRHERVSFPSNPFSKRIIDLSLPEINPLGNLGR